MDGAGSSVSAPRTAPRLSARLRVTEVSAGRRRRSRGRLTRGRARAGATSGSGSASTPRRASSAEMVDSAFDPRGDDSGRPRTCPRPRRRRARRRDRGCRRRRRGQIHVHGEARDGGRDARETRARAARRSRRGSNDERRHRREARGDTGRRGPRRGETQADEGTTMDACSSSRRSYFRSGWRTLSRPRGSIIPSRAGR